MQGYEFKKTPTITNTAITNVDTEYSYTIPEGVKEITFKLRAAGLSLRFAYVTGKVAGSTAPYFTLPSGSSKTLTGAYLSGLIIYFAVSTTGSQTVEIETWQ